MTNYDVLRNATQEQMALLLANLINGALGGEMKPDEVLIVRDMMYDFLGQEAKL